MSNRDGAEPESRANGSWRTVRSPWRATSDAGGIFGLHYAAADYDAFRDTVTTCFGDKRVARYFEQGVVTRNQIAPLLDEQQIFDEARSLDSYRLYNSLRDQEARRQSQKRGRKVVLTPRGIWSRVANPAASLVRTDLAKAEQGWLQDSIEKMIVPNIILAINTILADYHDKLLIEENSEGLRRLQDPMFRVSTRVREKLISLLSQMDGGSIAVAGLRGAGKSTLLKQFCQPLNSDIRSARTITVYTPAPSNYVAKDFIAELFQQLCQSYLTYCDYPPTQELHNLYSSRIERRQIIREALHTAWLAIRAAIAIVLLVLIIWPLATRSGILPSSESALAHQLTGGMLNLSRSWWINYRAYFALGLALIALEVWPPLRVWRVHLRRSRKPELIKRAYEYLMRLQTDKTVTQGTGVNSPNVRGVGLTINRSSSVKYIPWSLPELVSYTRRFMQDVSSQMKGSERPIVVAIDEIDRIGSLEDAEKFIGEIKTIFGVEGCYFLVAVAEEVGSLFAQRATAGRSILENAFDEIVAVEPLTLLEARSLLLKRVPGFTDAFVYLVYAMSGGLPRELIRVTRRLVEMNLERLSQLGHSKTEYHRRLKPEDYPRLEDLTRDLVTENMIEALDASRDQMSRLLLPPDWAARFHDIRSASITLGRGRVPPSKVYEVMKKIDELKLPDKQKNDDLNSASMGDEVSAARILNSLSAFAYFGTAVIEAFSSRLFNLATIRLDTEKESDNGYEELAAARIELGVSYASARLILDRFRASLHDRMHDTANPIQRDVDC